MRPGPTQRAGVVGETHHHALASRDLSDAIGVSPAVLQAEDSGVLAQHRQSRPDGGLGVVAFDEIEDQVDGPDRIGAARCMDRDVRNGSVLLLNREAFAIDGLDSRKRDVDEGHFMSGAGKPATEHATHSAAAAKHCDFHRARSRRFAV